MSEEFSEKLGYLLIAIGFIGWLTAVISDASHSQIGWIYADVLVYPLGIVRGFGMWFGLI
ncbi:hypothetical protein ACP179_00655 (plasmid) [Xenorhabdus stockiae]|uniref:hypothetical protein n=1 Tax=Xenorhabdus stockiae TaxID=351614 RepID=UPI003CECFF1F